MYRQSTFGRIDVADRAGTRNRLIGVGMTDETADARIAAWAHSRPRRRCTRLGYWDAAWY
jgi:hypothetical protein